MTPAQRARIGDIIGRAIVDVLEALDDDAPQSDAQPMNREPQKITELHKAKADRIIRRLGR